MEIAAPYKIYGDQTDSSIIWQDKRNALLRTHQIKELVSGRINSNISWDRSKAGKRAQKTSVAACLTALVSMAEGADVRKHIRLVENNDVPLPMGVIGPADLDLARDVDKIRYIISYYDRITAPNNVKDGKLEKQRDAIKYESTGKDNLTKDVKELFHKFDDVEMEMQTHVKLSSYLKISACAKILAKEVPTLRAAINNLPLSEKHYIFDSFTADVAKICSNSHVSESHHHDTDEPSSNSTRAVAQSSTPTSSSSMVNLSRSELANALVQARRQGQDSYRNQNGKRDDRRSPSPFRGGRGDARSRRGSSPSPKRLRSRQVALANSTTSISVDNGDIDDDESTGISSIMDAFNSGAFASWTDK
jgi:hypothetical protein